MLWNNDLMTRIHFAQLREDCVSALTLLLVGFLEDVNW